LLRLRDLNCAHANVTWKQRPGGAGCRRHRHPAHNIVRSLKLGMSQSILGPVAPWSLVRLLSHSRVCGHACLAISSSPTFSPCIDRISLLTRGRRPQSELKAMLAVAQKSRLCLSGNAASSMHPGRRPGNHCSVASLSEHGCDDKGSTTTMYCTWKRVCSSNRQPSKIIPRCAPSGAL
jgi:hypothetical protein